MPMSRIEKEKKKESLKQNEIELSILKIIFGQH